MKKIFLILVVILFAVLIGIGISHAAWLGTSPSTFPITKVEVEITYTAPGQPPVVTTVPGVYQISGTDVRLLDLAGRPVGQYRFKVKWADATGWWSDPSDPFDAGKPEKPGLRLLP